MADPSDLLTEDDLAFFAESHRQAAAAAALWDASAERLARDYGGRWIVIRDGVVVDHDSDAASLQQRLDPLDHALVRYVPRPGTEYAF